MRKSTSQPVRQQGPRVGEAQPEDVRAVSRGVERLGELAAGLGDLPLVLRRHRGEVVDGLHERVDPGRQCLLALERGDGQAEPVDQLRNRPARSTSLLSTSSSGSASPTVRRPSSSMVAPTRSRSRPACQVFCRTPSRWYGARASASSPHRTPERRTQSPTSSRASSSSPTQPGPHRRHRGQVGHLGGGEPGVGEVEQPGHHREHPVGLPQRPVGEPDPQRVSRVRLPRVVVEAAEGRSDEACVGLDVRRDTTMSRGSRVGSSASSPRSTSRSTSTWRCRPWQACTCTDRSEVASGLGARSSRMPPAAGRARCRPAPRRRSGCPRRPAAAAAAPARRARTTAAAGGPAGRPSGHRGARRPWPHRRRRRTLPQHRRRVRQPQCTSRCEDSASRTVSCSLVYPGRRAADDPALRDDDLPVHRRVVRHRQSPEQPEQPGPAVGRPPAGARLAVAHVLVGLGRRRVRDLRAGVQGHRARHPPCAPLRGALLARRLHPPPDRVRGGRRCGGGRELRLRGRDAHHPRDGLGGS